MAECGIQEQAGHTDDRVERRSDFVAHAGQEFAFGLVGTVQREIGL